MKPHRSATIFTHAALFAFAAASLASCKSDGNDAAPAGAAPQPGAAPSPVPAPSAGQNAPVHGDPSSASKAEPLQKLADGKIAMGPFALAVPAEWSEVPRTSNMRAAHFKLPAPEGKKAEVIVYYFGERGAGSVQDNVDRWVSQFKQEGDKPSRDVAKIEKLQVAGKEATLVSVSGRYVAPATPGGPPGDEPDQALIAAVVESPDGPYYFRLIGSREVVAGHEAEFRALLSTLTQREPKG